MHGVVDPDVGLGDEHAARRPRSRATAVLSRVGRRSGSSPSPTQGSPIGIEPVLDREGHAVQRADRAAAGEGLVEPAGPPPGGCVVASDHGVQVGEGVEARQVLLDAVDCPERPCPELEGEGRCVHPA